MIRTAIFALALASPATAATVAFDTGGTEFRWGADRSTRDDGGYGFTLDGLDHEARDGRRVIARIGAYNATITCGGKQPACGHTTTVGFTVQDGAITISGSLSTGTTLNWSDDQRADVNEGWSATVDLADGYTMDFGVLTEGTGSIQEGRWDYAYIYAPVSWVAPEPEQPAPVPLPGAGWLLACGLGALALRRAGK